MSITLLKTLVAISEQGSFRAAADRVCVSPAAVGQQMRQLEDLLGKDLFDRSRQLPQLNPVGKAMIPKARDIIHAYDTLMKRGGADEEMNGELTLGALPSMIRRLIPSSVKMLVAANPGLHIRVIPGEAHDLQEQVERGALDAAVVSKSSEIDPSLNWQSFAEEELVLIASPETTEKDPYKLLGSQPFIRHARWTTVGQLADEWLARHKINIHASMEMESLDNLTSMVAHGLGVSVVPNICMPDPIFENLVKLPLGEGNISRNVGVLSRADSPKTRLVDGLLQQINSTISDYRSGL